MEEEMVESREWVMLAYAEEGIPTKENLKLRTTKVAIGGDAVPDDHVALQVLCISVDPFLRFCMTGRSDGLCTPAFQLNQVITAYGAARIITSKDATYNEGDIVIFPFCPVAEYCVAPKSALLKIDMCSEISLAEYLHFFGIPGFAAWVGIKLIADPKPGENVFISSAAGAVGMFAGQLAKLRGCRVIGSVGTDEKVKLLKEELKFDDAFNYKKEENLDVALEKYFPKGIDIYFDNVGGKMLEAALNHVNAKARIPLCGMISQYNQVSCEGEGVRNLLNMIGKEVRMQGFLIGSHLNHFHDFTKEMDGLIKEGMLVSKVKVRKGIESFLDSLVSLFSSCNIGKVAIQVNK